MEKMKEDINLRIDMEMFDLIKEFEQRKGIKNKRIASKLLAQEFKEMEAREKRKQGENFQLRI